MSTEKYLDNISGKNISYTDSIDYSGSYAKEVESDEPKLNTSLDDVLIRFGFNEEITDELHNELSTFIENEVRLSCIEFIKRLIQKLNNTKWGWCFLKAMGYEADGLSYSKAGKQLFNCSGQYLHKLVNSIASSLDIEPIASLTVIRKYSRHMKVTASDDWYTMAEAEKYLGVSSRKLKQLIDENNITVKGYIRNSKLIHIDNLTLLETHISSNDKSTDSL